VRRLLTGHGGGYSTTSTIRTIYGSVFFENASNLHAGPSAVKSCSKKGGSGARGFAASPMTMTFVQLVLKKWGNSWHLSLAKQAAARANLLLPAHCKLGIARRALREIFSPL